MALSSKERAYLRSQAQTLSPVVMVGQLGVSENVIKALSEALEVHELVKVRFQDHKKEIRKCSEDLALSTESELVCITGFTSVFYKKELR